MPKTQPEPLRDPLAVRLLTAENSGVALIDFQRGQDATVTPATREEIGRTVTALAFGCEIMRNWARDEAGNLRTVMRWYFDEKKRLSGQGAR